MLPLASTHRTRAKSCAIIAALGEIRHQPAVSCTASASRQFAGISESPILMISSTSLVTKEAASIAAMNISP